MAVIGGGVAIGYAQVIQSLTESEGGKQMTNDERDVLLILKGFFFHYSKFWEPGRRPKILVIFEVFI